MMKLKRGLYCWVAVINLVLVGSAQTSTDNSSLTARQIMEKVDARDDGDRSTIDMEMVLIDKRGKQRTRNIRSFAMTKNERDEYSLMFFISPPDVRDTGFLTYDYDHDDKEDDQWLYLPALSKTKRIASSNRSDSFMGSDFTFADMTRRNLNSYDYTLMGEEEIDGQVTWQIQSIPNNEDEIEETGYTKSILFVRQDNFVVVRSVNWMKKRDHFKYFDTKVLKEIDGIWVQTEVHMTTKKAKKTLHKTVLRRNNVKFNQDIDEEMFTVRRLAKGL